MQHVFGDIPIYWINLERSTDRRQNMLKYLKDLNHTRIQAIDGSDPYFNTKYTIVNPNPRYTNSMIAVDCSHLKALQTAYSDNNPYSIILEDKCQFDITEHYRHTIYDIIKLASQKDNDWGIIQLSSVPIYQNLDHYKQNGLSIIDLYGAGANYLINNNSINDILQKINTNGKDFFDFTNVRHFTCVEASLYRSVKSYTVNSPPFYLFWKTSTFPTYYNYQNSVDCKLNIYKQMLLTANVIKNFYNTH